MRSFTCSLFIAVVSLMLAGRVPLALAAPPLNDTFAGATLVDLGHSEVLDTTEATTDSDDAQLNAQCGAPATDASVWYAIEGTGTTVVVNVLQSDYSAGVLVGVGSQGNLELIACEPGAAAFFAEAGTTYYVLAFDFQDDGGGNGGQLSISFTEGPPPSTVDLTVNRSGENPHTGAATISGTYTCTNGDFIDVLGEVRQNFGRVSTVVGAFSFSASATCDGEPHDWSADATPEDGRLRGGKALVVVDAVTCGPLDCAFDSVERTVQLRGGRKK
jgi:Family of unknown function (DUF6299)